MLPDPYCQRTAPGIYARFDPDAERWEIVRVRRDPSSELAIEEEIIARLTPGGGVWVAGDSPFSQESAYRRRVLLSMDDPD